MYPMIPCGNCGGPIQFFPQLAGCGVMCPHCGVTVQMPGGEEPQQQDLPWEPEATPTALTHGASTYRPRKRRQASMWPSVFLGGGLAIMLYFGVLKDSRWLVIQLRDESDSVPAALWRNFTGGLDGFATSGLFAGGVMFAFGLACFTLGRKTK